MNEASNPARHSLACLRVCLTSAALNPAPDRIVRVPCAPELASLASAAESVAGGRAGRRTWEAWEHDSAPPALLPEESAAEARAIVAERGGYTSDLWPTRNAMVSILLATVLGAEGRPDQIDPLF